MNGHGKVWKAVFTENDLVWTLNDGEAVIHYRFTIISKLYLTSALIDNTLLSGIYCHNCETSAGPIGATKCYFSPFKKKFDRPTDRPTNRRTGELILPIFVT